MKKVNKFMFELASMGINRRIIDKLSFLAKGRISFSGQKERNKFTSLNELIDSHFKNHTDEDHPNRKSLHKALELLDQKSAIILETGSSAWGINSSLLFDSYVNSFGGSFESVDIRLQPCISLQACCSSQSLFHCNDSVTFLKKWSTNNNKVDFVYLDSWDVNWDNPIPSALHGLNEYFAIAPSLLPGSLLLVDDTPFDYSVMENVQPKYIESFINFEKEFGFQPGKGAFIKQHLQSIGRGKQIAHGYQLLWQF